jgi:putative SOS response-associated peptidase YedK
MFGNIAYKSEMSPDQNCTFCADLFAGLWDGWQNPDTKKWLRTCVIITGEPNELVAQIHTRMPVILQPETHEQWLSGESGKEILRPFPAKEMTVNQRITIPACSKRVRWNMSGG